MNFWKYRIFDRYGFLLYQDCGFETEEDAEQEATEWAMNNAGRDWTIDVYQVWQELEYENPTPVLFFDPELQEVHAGIAYMRDVLCGECGGLFPLDEIEIIKEYTFKRDIERAIAGDKDYERLKTYNDYYNKMGNIPRDKML